MKKLTIFSAVILLVCSCDAFLNFDPIASQNASEQLKTEQSMKLYANGLIDSGIPSGSSIWGASGDVYSDICATKTHSEFFKSNYNPASASGWSNGNWSMIRRANYLLKYIERGRDNVEPEVFAHYKGVGYFWRAYAYISKVNTFGDVPWLDHVIETTDDADLYKGRDDRELVWHNILQDLDSAIEGLSDEVTDESNSQINRYTALALKSRACLAEGTFRKYHSVNPSTGKPWNDQYESAEELLAESARASEEIISSGRFIFSTTDAGEGAYRFIFSQEACNPEFIWAYQYSSTIPYYTNPSYTYNTTTGSQHYCPTRIFVRHYLKADGTPLSDDRLNCEEIFENRDPRMAQTLVHPGLTYQNGNRTDLRVHDLTLTHTGYTWHKWITEDTEHYQYSRDVYCLPIFRLTEIMLNYAEAKAELGQMTEAIWRDTIGKIRQRAGIVDRMPGTADYVPDPWLISYYSATDTQSGPAYTPSATIAEIRRERTIELVTENGLRRRDLYRWKLGERICEPFQGIYITPSEAKSGSFTFNGQVYKFDSKTTTTTLCLQSTGAETTYRLSEGNTEGGFLEYIVSTNWNEKLYLDPIPQDAININSNLTQNVLWN